MKPILLAIHLVMALVLIGCILLQSSQGGLGRGFGGTESFRSKRGAERVVFLATIIAAIIFLITSIINLLI